MSLNWFLVCEDCKLLKDVAQGYDGDIRATEGGDDIVGFLCEHKGHNLKFVSEHAEDIIMDCNEV